MFKFSKKKQFFFLTLLLSPLVFLALAPKKKELSHLEDSNRIIRELVDGYDHYKDTVFPLHEKEFLDLVKHGQKPGVLMITCSDSRIVLSSLFTSDPGEIFVIRNVGNIVPSYSTESANKNTSVLAAVEYALNVLGIKDIIVMGHSHCGAVQAIYEDQNLEHMHGLKQWLDTDRTVYKKAQNMIENNNINPNKALEVLEKFNIIAQIGHLRSYPIVQKALKDKSLFIHGWYYHFEDGSVLYYDPPSRCFKPLSLINQNSKSP